MLNTVKMASSRSTKRRRSSRRKSRRTNSNTHRRNRIHKRLKYNDVNYRMKQRYRASPDLSPRPDFNISEENGYDIVTNDYVRASVDIVGKTAILQRFYPPPGMAKFYLRHIHKQLFDCYGVHECTLDDDSHLTDMVNISQRTYAQMTHPELDFWTRNNYFPTPDTSPTYTNMMNDMKEAQKNYKILAEQYRTQKNVDELSALCTSWSDRFPQSTALKRVVDVTTGQRRRSFSHYS